MAVISLAAGTLAAGVLATGLAPSARAQPAVQRGGEQAQIEEVLDGATLRLAGGRVVRLAGISAPALPVGGGGPAQPLANEARAALAALCGQGPVRFYFLAAADRHGRTPAEVFDGAGRWLQGEMVFRGFARFQNDDGASPRGEELLALEKAARAGGRGIWGEAYYRVRRATETPHFIDSFQVVAGTVQNVTAKGDGVFLDFGDAKNVDGWRSDFSVFIPRPRLAALKRASIEAQGLTGQDVRVRGWIILRNGPMIELSHPDHLELTD